MLSLDFDYYFNQGEGIWTENDLKTATTTRNEGISFSLIAPNNLNEIFQDLNVDDSPEISIQAGMIEFTGLAEYLTRKESNFRESSVHVRCHFHTALKLKRRIDVDCINIEDWNALQLVCR